MRVWIGIALATVILAVLAVLRSRLNKTLAKDRGSQPSQLPAERDPSTMPVSVPVVPKPSVPPAKTQGASVPPADRPAPPKMPRESDYDPELDESELTVFTLREEPVTAGVSTRGDSDDDDEITLGHVPDVAAVPIVLDSEAAEDEPTRISPFILVSASGQTDKGQIRKNNEDSLLVLDDYGIYAVADGMGGHAAGEVASAMAVRTIEKAFREQRFDGRCHPNVPMRGSELARAIQMANKDIYAKAQSDASLRGMGTTVIAARFALNKQRVYIGHVGDSRCYRLRDDQVQQITTDHSMAAIGVLAPALAHQLTRAVGVRPSVEIDVIIGRPKPADTYLFCSDGLSKMLDDEELGHILMTMHQPSEAVDELIKRANDNGGFDNVTVILVKVVAPKGMVHLKPIK